MITLVMPEWFTWLMVVVTGWYIVDSLLGMYIRFLNRRLLKINERKTGQLLDDLNDSLQITLKELQNVKSTGDRYETEDEKPASAYSPPDRIV